MISPIYPMQFSEVADLSRRILDYPDAYFMFNKIVSWGSYIFAVSSLFFFYVVFHALRHVAKLSASALAKNKHKK